MANVLDIAELMIATAGEESDMTNLKLNKLLYFAQGTHLARTGRPLFEDEIIAWQLGPVVLSVYEKYKFNGKNAIPPSEQHLDFDRLFTPEEAATIADAILEYGKYSASYLVNRTHAPGTPWCETWDETTKGLRITKNMLRDFFSKRDAAPVWEFDPSSIPTIGYRNLDGVLVLPAAEDEGEDWSEYDEM